MFKPQSSFQSSFFGSFAYQGILARHQDHFLVRLIHAIDFSFVEEAVKDNYSNVGRHAYNPVIMIKLLLLQTLYDLSERDVIEQADTNILFRAFLGISLDDEIPHWTLLGQFRERLGEEQFEEIFNKVVVLAYTSHRIKDRSPDSEARTGHKSTHVTWYGYKEHISIDPSSDIVTAVITTSANVSDVIPSVKLIDKELQIFSDTVRPIRQVTGDKGYVGRTRDFKERNILDYTIPRNNMQPKKGTWYLSAKKKRSKIERIFAEGKTNHHLRVCRYWTRWKTHVQGLLIFLAMNLKRITNFLQPVKTA